MKEDIYWEEENKRACRLCGSEEKTWEHVWKRCRDWGIGIGELAGSGRLDFRDRGEGGGRRLDDKSRKGERRV